MKLNKSMNQALQAVLLGVAMVGIIGGVTYAALQSQLGVLQGNSIQTAIASLQVSRDGTTYGSTTDGYAFGNLIPGGQASPSSGYPVYVKNVGTTPLALKFSVGSGIQNPDNLNLAKVHIILTPTSGGGAQSMVLQDLITASSNGGIPVAVASHMLPSQVSSFTLQVSLDADAITGPGASLSNLDFQFGGLAVN